MSRIFEQFNMQNVTEGPTRITNYSKTLIDLIVATRKDLVKQKVLCLLGISDHDMIYATLSASVPRDLPKIITIRNFNTVNSMKGNPKVILPVRLFKSAISSMIQLMFTMHGICFSQKYATNMCPLNK